MSVRGRIRDGRAATGPASVTAVLIVGLSGIAGAVASAGGAVAAEACLPAATETMRVVAVPAADLLLLEDGRVTRAAGLASPWPLPAEVPAPDGRALAPTVPEGLLPNGLAPEVLPDVRSDRLAGPSIDGDSEDAAADAAAGEDPDVPGEFSSAVGQGARSAPAAAAAPPLGPGARASLASGEAGRGAAEKMLAALAVGRAVEIRPVGAAPDRHGRVVAHWVLADSGFWIGRGLVAAGAARVVPAGREGACAGALLAAEASARAAGLGLWADPAFAPLAADAPDLARAAGRYALVEGRILSTGHAGTKSYLNFGRQFRSDFTAVIDDKDVGRFRRAGKDPASMKGRTVRLRGWLTERDGGEMSLANPEEIEWTR